MGALEQSWVCSSGPGQIHALLSAVFLVETLNTDVDFVAVRRLTESSGVQGFLVISAADASVM